MDKTGEIKRMEKDYSLWQLVLRMARKVSFLTSEEVYLYACALWDAQMWANELDKRDRKRR